MTLHEAIRQTLKETGRFLSPTQLAEIINKERLYTREDGIPIKVSQIRARVRQYSSLFQMINGSVGLVEDKLLDTIMKAYWYIANSLRGHYSISDTQFILAVLFYFKRLVDKNNLSSKYLFNTEFVLSDDLLLMCSNTQDLDVESIFTNILSGANPNVLSSVDVLNSFYTVGISDEEFGEIFEHLLNLNSFDSQTSPIVYTPYSLRELMAGLLSPQNNKEILDPVASTGGLLIETLKNNKESKIIGYEINQRIALLGYMNLVMHGYTHANIRHIDCFSQLWDGHYFDYIIADLPISGIVNNSSFHRLFREYGITPPNSGRGFGALIMYIISKLSPTGKAVITVSESFLFKQGKEREIREFMISADIIETVIALPHGALRPYTSAKASVLVLNKNKNQRNQIKFIEAQTVDENKASLNLNVEEIIKYNFNPTDNKVTIVDISELSKDLNLSASIYNGEYNSAQKLLETESGKKLGDLVKIVLGRMVDKTDIGEQGVPVIKVENLSRDVIDFSLNPSGNFSRVRAIEAGKYHKVMISEECILISRLGEYLKPTFYKPSKEISRIILGSSVFALIPKDRTQLNLEYLYYQLYSPLARDQYANNSRGAVMSTISTNNLARIVIPLGDIDYQEGYIQSEKANIVAEEQARMEEKLKAIGYKEEIKNTESIIIRTLVHQLRPTLTNINTDINRIMRIVEQNNLHDFTEGININNLTNDETLLQLLVPIQDEKLVEVVNKLKNKSLILNNTLDTVNKVMNYKITVDDMDRVNLFDFMDDYLAEKRIEYREQFSIVLLGEKFDIMIDQPSFKELIDQLLINAERHAFRNTTMPLLKREVVFQLRTRENKIAIIEYRNNGYRFELTQKDFIKAFVRGQNSKGSGIGGNYIDRIVKGHSGDIIIRPGSRGFRMTIEIPLQQEN